MVSIRQLLWLPVALLRDHCLSLMRMTRSRYRSSPSFRRRYVPWACDACATKPFLRALPPAYTGLDAVFDCVAKSIATVAIRWQRCQHRRILNPHRVVHGFNLAPRRSRIQRRRKGSIPLWRVISKRRRCRRTSASPSMLCSRRWAMDPRIAASCRSASRHRRSAPFVVSSFSASLRIL
jgi:hypothetical protein